MNLVAFVGAEKEGYGQISALINKLDCEKIILIKDKKTENPFNSSKCVPVDIDTSQDVMAVKIQMQEQLKRELGNEFDVALSIASGNGKEHMALISALISVPVGVRFVVYTKKGVEFLS